MRWQNPGSLSTHMPSPAHDSDAESDLSHVSETSDEAEDGAPVRAQGDTEAESPAPPPRTAAPPLLPLTDPPAGAGVGLPVPLKTLTPPPPLKAPTPPPPHEAHTRLPQPLTAQHAAAACAPEVATALVGRSAHAAACEIATAFLCKPGPALCSTNTEDVWMHPALSAAADAFCAPQEPESFGESVFEVQSFESITEARRGDAQTSADADTSAHAPTATGTQRRLGYPGVPGPHDACSAEDEKHEHQYAAGLHASAATGAQPRLGYAGVPGPYDACGAEDEKHEHQCAAGLYAPAATGAQPRPGYPGVPGPYDACGAEDANHEHECPWVSHAPVATGARPRLWYPGVPGPYNACSAEDEKHEHECPGVSHAPAATGAQPRLGYPGVPGPYDACSAEDEKHEHECPGVSHAPASDQTNPLKTVEHQAPEEAELQAPEDKNTRNSFTQSMAAAPPLACVSGAPAPATASGTSAPRRRRRNELEALRPSAGATHKLLRGAAVTDPRIVGPMPSGCG